MARRRVFRTRTECPGITTDLGLTSNKLAIVGRTVTLQKSATNSAIAVCLDGTVVGHLDAALGNQVAIAIDRGQSFRAVIVNAYPIYDANWKRTSAHIDLKVDYLLEKGQPAIEIPKVPVAPTEPSHHVAKSFFTNVAGVTFEGRQRIIARCSVGEKLILIRDPNNRFDKGAIKVMRSNGEQLGFIPAHVSRGDHSSGLAFQMDHGSEYQCRISDITGGADGRSFGVNIEITEGQDFDGPLSTAKTPALSKVEPAHNSRGWFLFAALAALLLIIALITHNWF